ncbi:MAG: hypothetical protein FWE84_05015 [Firmicutes bacterium]|nr:hypothetical protein [Bacillota bacterium]
MKNNEFKTMFETDEKYRALIYASRELEICGWCPKAKHNKLSGYYDTCEKNRKDGVTGCHKCIAEHFTLKAK